MLKELKTYLKNAPRGRSYCEKILGNTADLSKFADFYDKNTDNVALVTAYHLHVWERDQAFTKEELVAYRQGLSEFPIFLEKCYKEIEAQKKKLKDSPAALKQ